MIVALAAAFALLAALDEPAPRGELLDEGHGSTPPPSRGTGRALWEQAGLTRERSGLESLLSSESLLARLVARSALLRTESRGVHFRTDFPSEDEAFAGMHVSFELGGAPQLELWR